MRSENIRRRRDLFFVFAVALYVASCGTVEVERPSGIGEFMPGNGSEETAQDIRELYVTGVEYPDGYDWHSDADYTHVACTLFLMKGDERILELPVDEDNMVSADPDMHRCYGGHLYTDFSTDTETIIKKDGAELFRYPDREMICGFIAIGDDIYTLGAPRDGDGWTFRKNGVITMMKTAGYLMTDLCLDGDDMWFAYVDPVVYGSGEARKRCYLVVNGNASPVGAAEDIETVDDVLLYGGKTYYTAKVKGMPEHVVYCGDEMHAVELGSGSGTKDCRVYYDGGNDIYVAGLKHMEFAGYLKTMWRNYISRFSYSEDSEVWYYLDGDIMNYVLSYEVGGKHGTKIYRDCINVNIGDAEQEYMFLGSSAACAEDGHFYAALHPEEAGTEPVLFSDSGMATYDFNGFFTSVSLW